MTHCIVREEFPEQDYIDGKIFAHPYKKTHVLRCLDCERSIHTSSYAVDDVEMRLLSIEHRLDALEGAI